MAYKFQLGAFTASGSIKAEEGFDADGQEASNFATISNGGSEITIAENTQVLGNVRISGSNALELGDNQHAIKNLANNLEFQVGGDTKLEVRGTQIDAKTKIQLSGSQALEFGGSNNRIFSATGVENLEFYANNGKRLEVRDNLVEALVSISSSNDLQAGGELQAATISLGDAGGIAGNGLTDSSGVLNIQLSGGANAALSLNADGIALATTISGNRTFSNDITIGGNLTVQGSTTTVDSTTINISSSFTFEGPADDFETVLHAGTPVADTTVYLPELAAGTYYIPAFDADPSGTSLSVTPAELNLLDGDATVGSSITIADTDGIIVNDGGVTKLVPASAIKDYAVAASSLASVNRRDGETLTIGMNYFSDSSTDASVVLPGSPEVGDLVYVKAGNLTSNAIIEVSRAGSQTIDGEVEVILESPYAAITLVYVASNDWRIV